MIYKTNVWGCVFIIFTYNVNPLPNLKKFLIMTSLDYVARSIDNYAISCLKVNDNVLKIHKKVQIETEKFLRINEFERFRKSEEDVLAITTLASYVRMV